MKMPRLFIILLFGCFLGVSLTSAPALADGGDLRNSLKKLDEAEEVLEKNVEQGLIYLGQEFDLSITNLLVINVTMFNALKLREVRLQKEFVARELLHVRLNQFFAADPLFFFFFTQAIATYVVRGMPPNNNVSVIMNPVLWQATAALATFYFLAYLRTEEGRYLMGILTQRLSNGQYGAADVYDKQY